MKIFLLERWSLFATADSSDLQVERRANRSFPLTYEMIPLKISAGRLINIFQGTSIEDNDWMVHADIFNFSDRQRPIIERIPKL